MRVPCDICGQWGLWSACASAQSDRGLPCPSGVVLDPWWSMQRLAKTLDRSARMRGLIRVSVWRTWGAFSRGAAHLFIIINVFPCHIIWAVPLGMSCGWSICCFYFNIYLLSRSLWCTVAFAAIEDSDQPAHLRSLIGVFAVRPIGNAAPRGDSWSVRADARADPGPRLVFTMGRLMYSFKGWKRVLVVICIVCRWWGTRLGSFGVKCTIEIDLFGDKYIGRKYIVLTCHRYLIRRRWYEWHIVAVRASSHIKYPHCDCYWQCNVVTLCMFQY